MARRSGSFPSHLYFSFLKLRETNKLRATGGALLGLNIIRLFQNPDAIDANVKTVKTSEFREQTGWDRLRIMFTEDPYGNLSPELTVIVEGSLMGLFTGTIIGGTLFSKSSFVKFIDENQGTAFQTTQEAKKQLQTKVTLGFARGAWIWGWRLGLFSGSFLMVSNAISVYRGKSSIWEYIIAGGTTGAIFKLKQGPQAMVAGGVLGGGLGTVGGVLCLGTMYLTGTSMQDLRYWQHQWKEEQQEKRLEMLRKARTEDFDELTRNHEAKYDPTTTLLGIPQDETRDKE